MFGVAILGAAFLLTWAAELAEMDISQGFAIPCLAWIAVLPEYAVDLYFAGNAATHLESTASAIANMAGANRLLIGVALPLIALLHWWRWRRRSLLLPKPRAVELLFWAAATTSSFVIPWRGQVGWFDALVLVSLFEL